VKKISRKFRLATVLKVAKLEEEAQQRATGEAARAQQAAAAEEAAREDAYAARPVEEAAMSAAMFQQVTQAAHLKAEALHVAKAETVEATRRLELAREDLMLRARRTHTLEDLEERHAVAYAVHAALAAQRTLDDLVRARRPGR
jgi:flagellar biosynthesis chaperone FliJ